MISSLTMNLTSFLKRMVPILLIAFLASSFGAVFGYAWCMGDDGHVGIDYVTDKSCCTDDCKSNNVGRFDVLTISQRYGEHCGLCLDFSAQPVEAVFFKRLKRTQPAFTDAVTAKGFSPIPTQNVSLNGGSLVPQSQPRISQTILAHRTVVLRN
jgi:hypothetical protein